MHPAAEPLIQRKPNHTPVITHTHKVQLSLSFAPWICLMHQAYDRGCRSLLIVVRWLVIFLQGMNPVVRLKTGFERFRTNVYKYVLKPKELCVFVQYGFVLN